jgi:hypothetical protein
MKTKTLSTDYIGQQVKVYRNLHTGSLSVQAKVDGRYKVVGHSSNLTLTDVVFKVSEAGRNRVLKEKAKNVHAFVVGVLESFDQEVCSETSKAISYNPYFANWFFVKETKEPVYKASKVVFKDVKPYLV